LIAQRGLDHWVDEERSDHEEHKSHDKHHAFDAADDGKPLCVGRLRTTACARGRDCCWRRRGGSSRWWRGRSHAGSVVKRCAIQRCGSKMWLKDVAQICGSKMSLKDVAKKHNLDCQCNRGRVKVLRVRCSACLPLLAAPSRMRLKL
jgi:hypothetical protein